METNEYSRATEPSTFFFYSLTFKNREIVSGRYHLPACRPRSRNAQLRHLQERPHPYTILALWPYIPVVRTTLLQELSSNQYVLNKAANFTGPLLTWAQISLSTTFAQTGVGKPIGAYEYVRSSNPNRYIEARN